MKVTKLDRVFSEYIRLRDADENGMVKCISCGKVQHWKDVDCGHFVNRKHMSVRFSEVNTAAQCRACNRFDEGNIWNFAKGLEKRYGDGIIDRIMLYKNQTVKYGQFEINNMVLYYSDKVKYLKTKKS